MSPAQARTPPLPLLPFHTHTARRLLSLPPPPELQKTQAAADLQATGMMGSWSVPPPARDLVGGPEAVWEGAATGAAGGGRADRPWRLSGCGCCCCTGTRLPPRSCCRLAVLALFFAVVAAVVADGATPWGGAVAAAAAVLAAVVLQVAACGVGSPCASPSRKNVACGGHGGVEFLRGCHANSRQEWKRDSFVPPTVGHQ